MTHCNKCSRDVEPVTDLGYGVDSGGHATREMAPVLLCPHCEAYLGPVEAPEVVATETTPEARKLAPVIRIKPATQPTPIDIESHCRARLDVITLELARHEGLKAEAKRLRAMLKASENACK